MPTFSNAQGVTINGGSFTDVTGGNVVTYNIQSISETGMPHFQSSMFASYS